MSPALLRRLGRALYGHGWHIPLGKALGIAPRTLQRWETGEAGPIPAGIWAEMRPLFAQRRAELDRAERVPDDGPG
jgi:hypothetical protein